MFDPSVPVRVTLPGDDERETTKGRVFLARVLTARQAPQISKKLDELSERTKDKDRNEDENNASAARFATVLLVGWEWPGVEFVAERAPETLLDKLSEQQLWVLLAMLRTAAMGIDPVLEKKSAPQPPESAPAT